MTETGNAMVDGNLTKPRDVDFMVVYAVSGLRPWADVQPLLKGVSEVLSQAFDDHSWVMPLIKGWNMHDVVRSMNRLNHRVDVQKIDLDQVTNMRDHNQKPYAVKLARSLEADKFAAGFSADDRQSQKVTDITLPECLMLNLGLIVECGGCLDGDGVTRTLCAGSRYGDLVPVVYGIPGQGLVITAVSSGLRDQVIRARAVTLIELGIT